MTIRTPLARAIRLAIGGAAGLSAAFAAPLVAAQEEQEAVIVVGSRIGASNNFESSSPIITLDHEDIVESGYTSLQQLLIKLPASGNGTFSTRGNNQDSTANGASAISLRGLGADATLVLVNGRRVTISSFAESITTNFVDINAIPISAIERVEVLKDGASAVYGSDAVAGVVNIVLRKDFDGFETSASYGEADGYDEQNYSAIWGTSSDVGNVTIIADYYKNSRLGNSERGSLGSADQTSNGGQDFRSSRGYPGSFVVDDGEGTPTSVQNLADPSCPADRLFQPNCVFDYGPYNMIAPASERTGVMVQANRRYGAVEVFAEFGMQHNRGEARGAPTPLDGDAGLTVPSTHPGTPFPQAVGDIGIRRYRTVDAGARQWDIETDNLRGLLGVRGEIGEWEWEVAGQYGRSESTQDGDRSMGWVRTDLLQQQINAGAYNPFSATQNPQDVIDQITTSLVRQGKSELTAFDATITGDLFDMPAGPVRMAAGAEYREESVSDVPDDQFQRGLIFGTESVSASADRDITSVFVEFAVPVLESVELQLAGRYDDYSDFGDTTNPKVGLRWEVTDTFAVRGSWAEGFRAPSLAQIGLGPSQESQFFQDSYYCAEQGLDPCPTLDYTIVFSGNPDLDAEDSESYNFGFVWQPTADFNLAVDYWDLTQENKIDEVPFGFLYEQFCNVQVTPVCVRQAPLPGDTLGELSSINASFINIGEQSAKGIDVEINYTREVGSATVTLGLNYSNLLEFERVELNSAGDALVSRELTGEYEYPEDRAVFTSDWTIGDWGIHTALNYIGSFEDQPDVDFDGILDYDTNNTRQVDSWMTTNVQVSYEGFKNVTLALGADNLFDEDVPFAVGDGDSDLYGYVASQHDPRGQYFYGKATIRF
jgi:outer membrane receptor protein involved in Fe transport